MTAHQLEMIKFIKENKGLIGLGHLKDWEKFKFLANSVDLPIGHEKSLDKVFYHVLAKFKGKKKDTDVPKCMKIKAYGHWQRLSIESHSFGANYCTDCTPNYQKKMLDRGLCIHPETQFYAKWNYQQEEWELQGKRIDDDARNRPNKTEIPLTNHNWVEEMLKLNYPEETFD